MPCKISTSVTGTPLEICIFSAPASNPAIMTEAATRPSGFRQPMSATTMPVMPMPSQMPSIRRYCTP